MPKEKKVYPPVTVGAIYIEKDDRSGMRVLTVEAVTATHARCRAVLNDKPLARHPLIAVKRLQSSQYTRQ